jgi:MOSC domain-containing protein YiiM
MVALVTSVSRSASHSFSKEAVPYIDLVVGLGVDGDAHGGATVKHRSRVARDPSQPNLRQVHLVHAELFTELALRGFTLCPGAIGENVTTSGLDLLELPVGTQLHLGPDAVVKVTGLRNPCKQLDAFESGLMAATLERASDGSLVRKAGVMAIVAVGGRVHAGDAIHVELPPPPHTPLTPV